MGDEVRRRDEKCMYHISGINLAAFLVSPNGSAAVGGFQRISGAEKSSLPMFLVPSLLTTLIWACDRLLASPLRSFFFSVSFGDNTKLGML